jgi:hypothetical protein
VCFKSEREALTIHPEKELIVKPEDNGDDDDDDDNEIMLSMSSSSPLPSPGSTISSFSGCIVSASLSLLRPAYVSNHLPKAHRNPIRIWKDA